MKVGVIGTGWGLRLIKTLDGLDAAPTLIYGHKNRGQLKQYTFTENIDEVFEVCDAVVVAVPPDLNIEMVRRAGKTNTNIFVEKPMASSLEEARIIVDIVNASGIVFMVGDCFCYLDNIDELRSIRTTHAISRIKRQSPVTKMNPYWNLAVHYIAVFNMLEIDDYAIELVLDKSFGAGVYSQMEFWNTSGEQIVFPVNGDYIAKELEHFLDCCRSGKTPLTNAEHGYEVIRQLSIRYGNIAGCLEA